MKGDIPDAAFRLSCSLPVRTHERDSPRAKVALNLREYRKRGLTQHGPAGIPRPVRVGSRTFESMTKAKEALRVSQKTLYAMIDSGEAEYET